MDTSINDTSSNDISDKNFVPISPWHDINLINDDNTYNMIVEIPKYNYMKMEINLKTPYNVIKQDTKKGKLRYYHNSIYWNYGALPKTYEYPKHIYKCQIDNKDNSNTIYFTGDNDPLDVVDIGTDTLKMGQIVPVKILGAFTLIDEGELDWKIIAINVRKKKQKISK
uniref:inorganic diphosphatase n=1 Tax=Piliocolobus tephrosceles TaxID=591936 RepID=A0A8C9H8U1_9PRIM